MDIEQAIAGRRSMRDYAEAAVDEAVIHRLVGKAVLAPSAMNEQPWTFTVVRNQALLGEISRKAKAHMLALLAGSTQSEHFAALRDENFHIFYHAPVLIIISGASQGSWIAEDCALAAQNLMLAAYGMGLGTCWIGFAQSYLNTEEGKGSLGIPDSWTPVAPIIVGHPVKPAPAMPRRAPIVRWVD
ncbi:MAG: nitroreductase [Hyphomicrobium sp.]|jgi:nitroreductase